MDLLIFLEKVSILGLTKYLTCDFEFLGKCLCKNEQVHLVCWESNIRNNFCLFLYKLGKAKNVYYSQGADFKNKFI